MSWQKHTREFTRYTDLTDFLGKLFRRYSSGLLRHFTYTITWESDEEVNDM